MSEASEMINGSIFLGILEGREDVEYMFIPKDGRRKIVKSSSPEFLIFTLLEEGKRVELKYCEVPRERVIINGNNVEVQELTAEQVVKMDEELKIGKKYFCACA